MIGLALATRGRHGGVGVPVPALDLDFRAGTMPAGLTFTRASSAWYFNSSGTLTSAATNAPRFDHDPSTLALRGLLVEEARTNSFRNNSGTGAAAGTPGTVPTNWSATGSGNGLTRQIVGTGTESGLPYVDIRYSGTATNSILIGIDPEQQGNVAASSGQTWTFSIYLRVVGGSLPAATHTLEILDRGPTLAPSTESAVTITTAALAGQRFTLTRTTTQSDMTSVMGRINLRANSGAAVDVTLRIGAPQLEQGAFATSPILTTSAAVTRAADVCSMATGSWYNASEGTLAVDWSFPGILGAGLVSAVLFDDATSNNQIAVRIGQAGVGDGVVRSGGVSSMDTTGLAVTVNAVVRQALAYATNNGAHALGRSLETDTSVTVPTVTRIVLNGSNVGAYWLRRVSYYNTRLSNTLLQVITV